jgi:hypothetical protein
VKRSFTEGVLVCSARTSLRSEPDGQIRPSAAGRSAGGLQCASTGRSPFDLVRVLSVLCGEKALLPAHGSLSLLRLNRARPRWPCGVRVFGSRRSEFMKLKQMMVPARVVPTAGADKAVPVPIGSAIRQNRRLPRRFFQRVGAPVCNRLGAVGRPKPVGNRRACACGGVHSAG